MENCKFLNLKNMKETIVNYSGDQKEFDKIWDAFYQMACIGFISQDTWIKFFDQCAGWYVDEENAKTTRYYTPEQDGLAQPWEGVVWCNPPYGRQIGKWVERAVLAAKSGVVVVMLLPARTDTKWFHEYIYGKAEIRFVRGRLRFGGAANPAPFPSMVVVFRGNLQKVAQLLAAQGTTEGKMEGGAEC